MHNDPTVIARPGRQPRTHYIGTAIVMGQPATHTQADANLAELIAAHNHAAGWCEADVVAPRDLLRTLIVED